MLTRREIEFLKNYKGSSYQTMTNGERQTKKRIVKKLTNLVSDLRVLVKSYFLERVTKWEPESYAFELWEEFLGIVAKKPDAWTKEEWDTILIKLCLSEVKDS